LQIEVSRLQLHSHALILSRLNLSACCYDWRSIARFPHPHLDWI
jgi:hypothetical protein